MHPSYSSGHKVAVSLNLELSEASQARQCFDSNPGKFATYGEAGETAPLLAPTVGYGSPILNPASATVPPCMRYLRLTLQQIGHRVSTIKHSSKNSRYALDHTLLI